VFFFFLLLSFSLTAYLKLDPAVTQVSSTLNRRALSDKVGGLAHYSGYPIFSSTEQA